MAVWRQDTPRFPLELVEVGFVRVELEDVQDLNGAVMFLLPVDPRLYWRETLWEWDRAVKERVLIKLVGGQAWGQRL